MERGREEKGGWDMGGCIFLSPRGGQGTTLGCAAWRQEASGLARRVVGEVGHGGGVFFLAPEGGRGQTGSNLRCIKIRDSAVAAAMRVVRV